ncbi:diaminobutyrate acetyltransferase [Paracoccaceae bacterium GXU_MW_L88]
MTLDATTQAAVAANDAQPVERSPITFREPTIEDGSDIWNLIGDCDPLDENSMYCNLVQCDHFAETCVLAAQDDEVVGWISAHLPPSEDDVLFIWQVAVADKARGQGLASRMLRQILSRSVCGHVTRLQTTITKDNDASWALFTKLAKDMDAALSDEPYFKKEAHFDGEHATEHLVTIRFPEALESVA